jgi:hypothetical protein
VGPDRRAAVASAAEPARPELATAQIVRLLAGWVHVAGGDAPQVSVTRLGDTVDDEPSDLDIGLSVVIGPRDRGVFVICRDVRPNAQTDVYELRVTAPPTHGVRVHAAALRCSSLPVLEAKGAEAEASSAEASSTPLEHPHAPAQQAEADLTPLSNFTRGRTLECGSVECANPAVWRVFWPGQSSIVMCQSCRRRAEGVAEAMGFALHSEPRRENG